MQGFDLLLTILLWMILDSALGFVLRERYVPLPVLERVFTGLLGGLARKLNRPDRSQRARIIRGAMLLLISLGMAHACSLALNFMPMYAGALTIFLGMSGTGLLLCGALPDVPTQKALANAPLLKPDDSTRRRLAIQALLFTLTASLIVPIVLVLAGAARFVPYWYACLWLIRQHGRDGQSAPFAAPAAFVAALPLVVAQFVAAFLLAVASLFAPKFNIARVAGMPFRAFSRAPVLMGGLPLAVVAFGLGKTLGGPRQHIEGTAIANPWVGAAHSTAQLEAIDLKATRYAVGVVLVLFFCIGTLKIMLDI